MRNRSGLALTICWNSIWVLVNNSDYHNPLESSTRQLAFKVHNVHGSRARLAALAWGRATSILEINFETACLWSIYSILSTGMRNSMGYSYVQSNLAFFFASNDLSLMEIWANQSQISYWEYSLKCFKEKCSYNIII